MNYQVFAPDNCQTEIVLPASKSISNRALIINALCGDAIPVENLSECDDTRVMKQAFDKGRDTIDIHGAGTAMRFLTAYYAQKQGGECIITGSERMKQRPIKILVDALRSLGAHIEYLGNEGFPPLRIIGKELKGGSLTLPGNVSSQYISALLMIAPRMQNGLTLTLTGEMVSVPYIEITLGMMAHFGIIGQRKGNIIHVPAGQYRPEPFRVEPDWSAASYWYEIAALAPKARILLPGLSADSLQGDAHIARLFEPLGIETRFTQEGVELIKSDKQVKRYECDLSEQPDLAQTMVVSCCLTGTPFCFTGLQTLRIKETDRISALQNELIKLGYKLISSDNSLTWNGEMLPPHPNPAIDTYDDHRMAMAFAPAAFRFPGIEIKEVAVVDKSYPLYWDDLHKAGFTLTEPKIKE